VARRISSKVVAMVLLPALGAAAADRPAQSPPASPPQMAEAPEPSQFEEGLPPAALAMYKTVSYTSVVLMTDQFWYMVMASEAAASGGWFGIANAASSPMLTFGFEYLWNQCCEAGPGPDGVVSVSARKAAIYRVFSMSRTALLTVGFGNSLASSAAVTTAISVTRTGAYVLNDYVWGQFDVRTPRPPTSQTMSGRAKDRPLAFACPEPCQAGGSSLAPGLAAQAGRPK